MGVLLEAGHLRMRFDECAHPEQCGRRGVAQAQPAVASFTAGPCDVTDMASLISPSDTTNV